MRCPDCGKFVSNEQGETELNLDVTLDENLNAQVTGNARLILNCGECSSELAESSPSVDVDVTLIHDNGADDHDVSIEDESVVETDRYDGKPGTPSRYRRHFYGATITGTVKCTCGAQSDFSITVEGQAGAFEQL